MKRLFGTDGIRGVANEEPMTTEIAMQVGRATAYIFKSGAASATGSSSARTRGFPATCSRTALAVRDLLDGRGRAAGRAAADAGHRLHHLQHAGRRRHRDLGLAQPLSGQRHQDLRRRRLQAPRRRREADRGADLVRQRSTRFGPPPPRSARPSGWTTPSGATSSSARTPSPQDLDASDGMKIVLDCANGAAYKVAPTVFEELGAEVVTCGVRAQRREHQHGLRLPPSRGRQHGCGQGHKADIGHRAGRRRRPGHVVRRERNRDRRGQDHGDLRGRDDEDRELKRNGGSWPRS